MALLCLGALAECGADGWNCRFKYDWRIDMKDGAAAGHSIAGHFA
jgi:hypothetical protein